MTLRSAGCSFETEELCGLYQLLRASSSTKVFMRLLKTREEAKVWGFKGSAFKV